MADVMARVQLKCRVSRVDPATPKKELGQHHEIIQCKTQVIDSDEWLARKFIATWILEYGFDMFF